jgi:hypothetical protein
MEYRIIVNQGSDYIIDAPDSTDALEQFEIISRHRGLNKLNGFEIIGIEEVLEERPARLLNGVKVQ